MKTEKNLTYSLRRIYIDEFLIQNIRGFGSKSIILDVGGHKNRKRGMFDIREFDVQCVCVNIDDSKGSDLIGDAMALPLQTASVDGIICSEVIEHVHRPAKIIEECGRVLKSGGVLLGTSPFLVWLHGDPEDYGRYTPSFLKKIMEEAGFEKIEIREQGGFFSVLSDMLRQVLWIKPDKDCFPLRGISKAISNFTLKWIRPRAAQWDLDWNVNADRNKIVRFTTGFEWKAVKK